MYSVMWSEHCSYKSSKIHLRQFAEKAPKTRRAARRHGRERRRGRRRRRLGGHLQDRVAQPPVLRRAVPGRGHRRRRHRARHPDDGCAPGRRDGLAALRPGRRRGHRPGAAGRGRWHRRLRQLPRPAEHRRRGRASTTPTSATRWSTRCASACMRADEIKLAKADGPGNQVVLFGARTGGDGIGGVSVLASATFDDAKTRPSGRACRSATRSPRRCSSSAAWRSSPPIWWSASRTSARAGLSCATTELAGGRRPAAWTSSWTGCRCGTRRCAPEEILMSESQERMMAVVAPEQARPRSWPSAPSGTCSPPSSARSPTPGGCG